jgi:hypothetical protein
MPHSGKVVSYHPASDTLTRCPHVETVQEDLTHIDGLLDKAGLEPNTQ